MTATILEFRQAEGDKAETDNQISAVKETERRSAEIVIFPGVRIERETNQETRKVSK